MERKMLMRCAYPAAPATAAAMVSTAVTLPSAGETIRAGSAGGRRRGFRKNQRQKAASRNKGQDQAAPTAQVKSAPATRAEAAYIHPSRITGLIIALGEDHPGRIA